MRHVGTQPIETARLLLRRFSPADAEEMYANWASDPQVTQFMRWEPHADVSVSRAILADWQAGYAQDDYYHWAIVRKEDGALLGSIGILHGSDGIAENAFEPGYCIGRAFWGNGYTSEALAAAVAYFLRETGAKELFCCHAVQNPASGRVMEKAGFVFTHDGVYHGVDDKEIPAKYYKLSSFDKGQ